MSTPVAIRFDDELLADVRRVAKRRSMSVSAVVKTFTDEGIRTLLVPGIMFREGPAGRRPAVAGSLDVWEIIGTLRDASETTDTAALTNDAAALARATDLPERVILIALEYYRRYPAEIDDWIAEHEREAEQARSAWLRQRGALV